MSITTDKAYIFGLIHISHIRTIVNNEQREHLLGFMQWNSITHNFEYSALGAVQSLSELSSRLVAEFTKPRCIP